MSNKETVMEIVRSMPDDATIEEILEEVETLAAIRRAEVAADQGRLISHEEVKERFESWLSKLHGPTSPSPTSKGSPKT